MALPETGVLEDQVGLEELAVEAGTKSIQCQVPALEIQELADQSVDQTLATGILLALQLNKEVAEVLGLVIQHQIHLLVAQLILLGILAAVEALLAVELEEHLMLARLEKTLTLQELAEVAEQEPLVVHYTVVAAVAVEEEMQETQEALETQEGLETPDQQQLHLQ